MSLRAKTAVMLRAAAGDHRWVPAVVLFVLLTAVTSLVMVACTAAGQLGESGSNHAAVAGVGRYTEFVFAPYVRYAISASVLHVTDIAMQSGEVIGGRIEIGDSSRWVISTTSRGQEPQQQHILVKPVAAGLSTNLVIHTDRRIYLLDLHSVPPNASFMDPVGWLYPNGSTECRAQEAPAITAAH